MAGLGDVYEQLRDDISGLVSGLESQEAERSVPATPGWSIRDVVAHLAADATFVIAGDFPGEIFQAFGDAATVTTINNWTARQLKERAGRPLDELLRELKDSGNVLAAMMRGEEPWPEDSFIFLDRVILTDAAVHQQDIFGALGIERARQSAAIKIGLSGYIATVGWRLASASLPPLRFDVGDKQYTAGEGEPGATVHTSRFEFFRAMSGRRNPDQISSYEWDGDPKPYIPYFYPYGMRDDALVE
ncbi:MAG: maleylpyruvate isomerase family mycothiol-dependent enzyme [Actinobacteria bacterium]|nr:maleylpyruvate isomerase family mycothiol-dependent enzyme [Actinomycetota bacterium]